MGSDLYEALSREENAAEEGDVRVECCVHGGGRLNAG
jgi:hypothetical protein